MIDPRTGVFYPDYPGQPDPRMGGWSGNPAATPRTRYIELIPIDSEAQVPENVMLANLPLIYVTKDEKTVIIKSAGNGGTDTAVYDRRPPAPKFDPAQYPTMEQVAAMIDERMATAKRQKKEAPASEPV